MIIGTVDLLSRTWLSSNGSSLAFQCLILILTLVIAIWLGWRIWRFSICPLLHPQEPREVPYWIPFIGHTMAFLKSPDKVLSYGREYFENSREPFALTLGREKMYILTSPDDVVTAMKNRTTLDDCEIIRDLMLSFGASHSGVKQVFAPKPAFIGKIRQQNPQGKSLFNLKEDFYHTQLHPGEQFNIIQKRFLELINQAMESENLLKIGMPRYPAILAHTSLWKLCQQIFVSAGIEAFFGAHILDINAQLLQDFIEFDDNNWMIFFNWPGPQAKKAREPMTRVLHTLERFIDLPKADRPGTAWLIDTMEESSRQLGIKPADRAVVLLMVMWVVNTNAYRVAFWMIAYILHSPDLFSTIREETAPALAHKGALDIQFLTSRCPHLDSLWFEVLRLTTAASAVRTVDEPTQIGTKVLMPGHKVMSPFRQLHFDEAVFGSRSDQCDPDRFFHDKDLSRHRSYKPFGGGRTMCPGRFVARQEVYTFIALLLHKFTIALKAEESFPRFDLDVPTTGVISPKPGDDVNISIRGRSM